MTRHIRTAAVHLALVAMFMAAMLPAGWMLGGAGSGAGFLTICTASSTLVAPPASKGEPAKQTPSNARDHACPFAASNHLSAPVLDASVMPARMVGRLAFSAPPAALFRHLRFAPQSLRGPPSLA